MAKYLALRDTWLSHENRLIKAGDEFEAVFPEGMKFSDNIRPADTLAFPGTDDGRSIDDVDAQIKAANAKAKGKPPGKVSDLV